MKNRLTETALPAGTRKGADAAGGPSARKLVR
jgi:hypothetical protein